MPHSVVCPRQVVYKATPLLCPYPASCFSSPDTPRLPEGTSSIKHLCSLHF